MSGIRLSPEELIGDIEQAYEEDLLDPGYIGFDEIKRDLAIGKDRVLARLAEGSRHRPAFELTERRAQPSQPWRVRRSNERPRRVGTSHARAAAGRNTRCVVVSSKRPVAILPYSCIVDSQSPHGLRVCPAAIVTSR